VVRANFHWSLLLLSCLLLAGCAGVKSLPSSGEAQRFWRGILVQEEEGYRFEPCGRGGSRPVVHMGAPLAAEYARQSLGEGWPVYVEAFGTLSSEGVALNRPVLVGGSLQVCDHHLPGVDLRGVASRDRAVFDLRGESIRVSFEDSLHQLGFRRPEVERRGAVRRWQQVMSAGGGRQTHELVLEVEARDCVGPHGAWYALSMKAELDGRYYQGCARLGDLEHWQLFTGYQTPPSLTTRRVGLQLERDGSALLLEDYLNEQPVLEHRGQWRMIRGDRLEIRLDEEGLSADSSRLVFALALDGRLQLTHFHPAYGRELELLPAGSSMVQQGELDWWQ